MSLSKTIAWDKERRRDTVNEVPVNSVDLSKDIIQGLSQCKYAVLPAH